MSNVDIEVRTYYTNDNYINNKQLYGSMNNKNISNNKDISNNNKDISNNNKDISNNDKNEPNNIENDFKVNNIKNDYKVNDNNFNLNIKNVSCEEERYIAHEIINPLSIIRNCAELMQYQDDKIHNKSFFIDLIIKQVDKCVSVSKTLLDNKNNCPKIINILCFLKKYIENENFYKATNNIILINNIPSNLNIKLKNTCVYLKIIFDNIISNIFKYSSSKQINISYNKINVNNISLLIQPINESINENNNIKSNNIGLELINTLSKKLGIKWKILDNKKIIIYQLIFPINYEN